MPQQIAQIEHALTIVPVQNAMVGVQIGHIGHFRAKTPVFRLCDVAGRARQLQRAKISTERELLVVGDVLVMKHQNRIFVHPGVNRRDILGA